MRVLHTSCCCCSLSTHAAPTVNTSAVVLPLGQCFEEVNCCRIESLHEFPVCSGRRTFASSRVSRGSSSRRRFLIRVNFKAGQLQMDCFDSRCFYRQPLKSGCSLSLRSFLKAPFHAKLTLSNSYENESASPSC